MLRSSDAAGGTPDVGCCEPGSAFHRPAFSAVPRRNTTTQAADRRSLPVARGTATGAAALFPIAVTAVSYYAAARLGLRLSVVEENITPLWPPTGIAVAALFVFGARVWPGIALAAFAVNVPINDEVWAAASTAVGNTAAPAAAVAFLRRAGFHRELDRLLDAVVIVVAALGSMTISATIGSVTLLATGSIGSSDLPAAWSAWWAGDAMGVLAVAPFLLTMPELRKLAASAWRKATWIAIHLAGVLVVTTVVMATSANLLFVVLLAVGVTAWRFQQAGATPSALIASTIASFAAARGLGPFEGSVLERMLTLQTFNASVALGSFVFAAIVAERSARRAELEALNLQLEDRVAERTAELSVANERLEREVRERREAEASLRLSERRLAEAQSIARVGSWEWDLETDLVSWSDEMFVIHGLTPGGRAPSFEEILTFIVDEDVPRVRANVAAALERRRPDVPSIEYSIHRPDGVVARVLGTGRIVVRDGRPVRMTGTVQDLTERLARQREHRIAEELQRALLPQELPSVAGIELDAHYVPAESDLLAGGDWYDAIRLPDGRLVAVIGDVAGHGLEAASLMAQIRMAVRAVLATATDPAETLASVDDVLRRFGPAHMSTMLVVFVDRAADSIAYGSAGHLSPALVADGVATYLPGTGDPPLGTAPDHPFRTLELPFVAGSTLVLFTDGLVDRRDADLGAERARVLDVVRLEVDGDRAGHGELTGLARRLVSTMLPEEPDDDVAVLCLRAVDPPAPVLRLVVPARAGELATMRRELRAWCETAGVMGDDADDVVVACNEAVSNVIEHANAGEAIRIEARTVADRVEIEIRDAGSWRDARPSVRGRGLALIRSLTDSFEVSTGRRGTVVTLGRRIGRAP